MSSSSNNFINGVALLPDGKYLVQINGSIISPCEQDSDCPSFAVCWKNVTWNQLSSFCGCYYPVGVTGEQCLTPIPGWFGALITISSVIILINFVCAFILLYIIFLLPQDFRRINAYNSTLIFLLLGTSLLGAYHVTLIARTQHAYNPAARGFLLGAFFFFITLASLNVSLVWLEIAIQSKKFTARATHNISRYRNLLFLYYLIFMTLTCYFIAVGESFMAEYVAIPAVLFIVVSYMAAFFKIRQLYPKDVSSSSNNNSSIIFGTNTTGTAQKSADSSPERQGTKKLREIASTSMMISISYISCIGFLVGLSVLGPSGDSPFATKSEINARFVLLSVSLVNIVITRYLYRIAQTKANKKKMTSKMTVISALVANNNTADEKIQSTSNNEGTFEEINNSVDFNIPVVIDNKVNNSVNDDIKHEQVQEGS